MAISTRNSPVHILTAANQNYILPMTVMLVSVAANFDPRRELVIHIVNNDATDTDRENVRKSILMNRPKQAQDKLNWYRFDESKLQGLPVVSYFSREVYAGLVGLSFLPPEVKRVITLDCDLIILKDLSELYDLATAPTMAYAAQDLGTPFVSSKMGVFDYAERGMDPLAKMFNSGVVVHNVTRWQNEDMTGRILKYMEQNADRVNSHDQAGQNALLYQDWTELDLRWNSGFDSLFFRFWKAIGRSKSEWRAVRNHPYIVHYSGAKKPWQKNRRGPRYSYFFKYLKRSAFKDSLPGHPVLESIIGFRLYFHLWRTRHRLRDYIRKLKAPDGRSHADKS